MAGFRIDDPRKNEQAGEKPARWSDPITDVKWSGAVLALCAAAGVCAALLILSLIRQA